MKTKNILAKLLSTLLALSMVFGMFAAFPIKASAAIAQINLSTLGDANAYSGSGIDQWRYVPGTSRTLYLEQAGGQYDLTGNNSNLTIWVESAAVGARISFGSGTTGINVTSQLANRNTLNVQASCEIYLAGNSSLTSNNTTPAIHVLNGSTVTFIHNGSLTATATAYDGIYLSSGSNLILKDEVSVTANGWGIYAGIVANGISSTSIEVSSKARLDASGGTGYRNQETGGTNLKVDGIATFSGTGAGGYGIRSNPLNITGTGTVSATGASGIRSDTLSVTGANVTAIGTSGEAVYMANPSNAIFIGDTGKLTMTNGYGSAEAHIFTKSSAAVTHRWSLSGGVSTADSVTGASISATLPAGATGTVRRTGPINVSSFGLLDATSEPGNDAWRYVVADRTLYLTQPGGDYILTGTNTNLGITVDEVAKNASITFETLNIITDGTRDNFVVNTDCNVALTGTNRLASNGNGISVDQNVSLAFSGRGSLTVPAPIRFLQGAKLNITDTASVTVNASNSGGILLIGTHYIDVAQGASLNVTGRDFGLGRNNSGLVLHLNVDGAASFASTATGNVEGYGIHMPSNGILNITGKGTVSAKGTGMAGGFGTGTSAATINITDNAVTLTSASDRATTVVNISMNDAAKLTLSNGSTSAETHTFSRLGSATTHNWKLTNATTSHGLSLMSIDVTVAAGATGVIERERVAPMLVSAAAIGGVTSPVGGATPSPGISGGTGFTAALAWDGNPATFAYSSVYTATVTLTAASGYTFSGGFANTAQIAGFRVNSIAPVWVSNNGTRLVFKVTFPATGAAPTTPGTTPDPNKPWKPPLSTNRFNDVPNAPNWQNAAVSWADSNGITTGSPAGSSTFKPNDTITRAEFVTFFHRIYGSPSTTRATFSDMPVNPAFQNSISWAFTEGITTGSPAGSSTFMPGDNITREQIAAMLYRYIGGGTPVTENKLGGHTDHHMISTWAGARDAVNWAVHNGIMGVGVTILNPRGNATRAEAVTMLYRVVEIFNISAP